MTSLNWFSTAFVGLATTYMHLLIRVAQFSCLPQDSTVLLSPELLVYNCKA